MSKQKAIESIQAYRKYYTDISRKIAVIRADQSHTAEWKNEQIAKLMSDYNANNAAYKDAVRDTIKDIKTGIEAKRQENIKNGLESAEAVNLIIGGIQSNSYTKDTLNDIINVYAENPIALQSIRGALLKSESDDLRIIGTTIKQDTSDRVMMNLDKITTALDNIPSVDADSIKDWNAGFYQNGTSFDGWTAYISENIE